MNEPPKSGSRRFRRIRDLDRDLETDPESPTRRRFRRLRDHERHDVDRVDDADQSESEMISSPSRRRLRRVRDVEQDEEASAKTPLKRLRRLNETPEKRRTPQPEPQSRLSSRIRESRSHKLAHRRQLVKLHRNYDSEGEHSDVSEKQIADDATAESSEDREMSGTDSEDSVDEDVGDFVVSDDDEAVLDDVYFDCVCKVKQHVIDLPATQIKVKCKNFLCQRWCHGACFGINEKWSVERETFLCHKCRPTDEVRAKAATSQLSETIFAALTEHEEEKAISIIDGWHSARSIECLWRDFGKFTFDDNRSPLHLCCAFDRPTILSLLISEGDCDQSFLLEGDDCGLTPLHVAAQSSASCVRVFEQSLHKKVLRKLLRCKDSDGLCPIACSIKKRGNPAALESALRMAQSIGCDITELLTTDKQNLVHIACRFSNFAALRLLRDKFPDVFNVVLKTPSTANCLPVHFAAASIFLRRSEEALECLELIVDCLKKSGRIDLADIRDKPSKNPDASGFRSPVLYALGSGVPEEIREDDDDTVNEESDTAAEERVVFKAVELFLQCGASVFSKDVNRTSLLHLAAVNGFVTIVDELLRRHFPADEPDKYGWTPLLYVHVAASVDNNVDVSDAVVVSLLNAKPTQLYGLHRMLGEGGKKRKTVISLIKTLAQKPFAYRFLNDLVRRNPRSLLSSLKWLKNFPTLLDFENRRTIFLRDIRTLDRLMEPVEVVVQRGAEFPSLCYETNIFARRPMVTGHFEGELGCGPGVSREVWSQVMESMLHPDVGLFAPPDAKGVQFFSAHDTRCCVPEFTHVTTKVMARRAGQLIATAIIDRRLLAGASKLSPAIFASITGEIRLSDASLDDFKFVDPQLHQSWTWLLENPVGANAGLTFSLDFVDDAEGKVKTVPLKGSGSEEMIVDDSNKEEFVALALECTLNRTRKKLEGFLQGFHEVIPELMVRGFKSTELESIIAGESVVDVDAWERTTQLTLEAENGLEVVQWFWLVVREDMTDSERAGLLSFSTGSPRVPPGGWNVDTGEVFKIVVSRLDGGRLPTASTCFNLLKLPCYKSRDQLREKVLLAVRHGAQSFDFV